MTMAYHPKANEKPERTNKKLKQYLQKYANYQQNNQLVQVPLAEYAYNIVKSRGINFISYQVVYVQTLTMHAIPGKPSQAAIDKIKNVAYENQLYNQVLLQKHRNKWEKITMKLKPGDKTYVKKCKARKN